MSATTTIKCDVCGAALQTADKDRKQFVQASMHSATETEDGGELWDGYLSWELCMTCYPSVRDAVVALAGPGRDVE